MFVRHRRRRFDVHEGGDRFTVIRHAVTWGGRSATVL